MAREMKDSGIEWIGEIPFDWECRKLKTFVKLISKGATPSEMSLQKDERYCIGFVKGENIINGTISFDNINYITEEDNIKIKRSQLEKDDILYVIAGSIGKCGIVNKLESVVNINQAISFIRLKSEYKYLIKYLFFYFQSDYAMLYSQINTVKSALPNLSMDDLANMYITIPIQKEAIYKITSFLNIECAKIDDVINKTKATIEEYKKLKQSVITEAVTKGIRPNREMKDSGIEWIGEIPKEWKISLIKYHLKWKSEKGFSDEQVLSLYRDYGVIPKDSRDDNHNVTSLDTSTYKLVDIGDFVINKMKAWQGSMAVSEYRGIISPAYHICEFYSDAFIKRYFHYLMRNNSYLPEYERLSTGMRIGQWDLGFDDFKNIPIIIPSLSEQQEIADYLDKKCSEIDTLIAKKEQIITELESYKKSIIYEYVTGKKEVI